MKKTCVNELNRKNELSKELDNIARKPKENKEIK